MGFDRATTRLSVARSIHWATAPHKLLLRIVGYDVWRCLNVVLLFTRVQPSAGIKMVLHYSDELLIINKIAKSQPQWKVWLSNHFTLYITDRFFDILWRMYDTWSDHDSLESIITPIHLLKLTRSITMILHYNTVAFTHFTYSIVYFSIVLFGYVGTTIHYFKGNCCISCN